MKSRGSGGGSKRKEQKEGRKVQEGKEEEEM